MDFDVFTDLRDREPLFHRREFVHSRESFDASTAEDFWEVGASGRVYDRDYVRRIIIARFRNGAIDPWESGEWDIEDFAVRCLADGLYMATYRLNQRERRTRRTTLWKRESEGRWIALYHQGTSVGQ